MSKEITLIATENGASNVFVADDNDTILSVFEKEEVCDFFDVESADDIIDCWEFYNDVEVTQSMVARLLNARVADGDVFKVALDGVEHEEDQQDDEHGDANGTRGFVTVAVGYNSREISVPIVVGTTTIYDAMFSSEVLAGSGLTAPQLSNTTIAYSHAADPNAAINCSLDYARSKKLEAGDYIAVSTKPAGSKGALFN